MEKERALTLDDFWSLRTVNEFGVSPDGATVAYVVGRCDEGKNVVRSAIWLVDIEDGTARGLTSGESSDTSPRWSPDGSQLAFVSTRHEDKPQVFIMNVRGGEPRRVTSAEDGALSPLWSPDGSSLCFSSPVKSQRQDVPQESAWFREHPDADAGTPRMRRLASLPYRFDGRGYIDRRTHLFLIDLHTPDAEARQLTEGDWDCTEPAWSPDGTLIAFMSNRTDGAELNMAADIWTVDIGSGELRCLTNGDLTAFAPGWSPDGRQLAFYGSPEEIANGFHNPHVWTVSREGGDQRDRMPDVDLACPAWILPDYTWIEFTPPAWSPDGKTIAFIATQNGDAAVWALDLPGGGVQRLSRDRAHVAKVQWAGEEELVCAAATPTHPFELFTLPASGGQLKPLTQTNRDLLEGVMLSRPERLVFEGPGGWEIEGWLMKPTGTDSSAPVPLILNIHGGPQGAFGNTFYFHFQALAGSGYAVLYINPRGSVGYGEAFARAADWGEDDFRDLMAGVDAALENGEIDRDRMGITGLSYGGFMTNWAIGHTDRFAAAVSINGISNMFSFYGVSDIGPQWIPGHLGGRFWEDEPAWQRYRRHSPITYVGNVSTPLLLLQSENDYRCPIEQGEQMLSALRALGKTVEMVRIPDASHVIFASGAPHQRYFERVLARDWFDLYLKGRGEELRGEEAGITVEMTPVPGNG